LRDVRNVIGAKKEHVYYLIVTRPNMATVHTALYFIMSILNNYVDYIVFDFYR